MTGEQAAISSEFQPQGKKTMVSAPQMPLAMVSGGETVRVLSIRGKDEVQRFLRNLGFVEGAEVTVVSELGGNVIVCVKGTRIAVSKSMATRVVTG